MIFHSGNLYSLDCLLGCIKYSYAPLILIIFSVIELNYLNDYTLILFFQHNPIWIYCNNS